MLGIIHLHNPGFYVIWINVHVWHESLHLRGGVNTRFDMFIWIY